MFQSYFGCSRFFKFPYEFWNHYTNFYQKKKLVEFFYWNCAEFKDQFAENWHLNNIECSDPWTSYIRLFFIVNIYDVQLDSPFVFYFLSAKFSVCRSCTFLSGFIPKYFILSNAIVNGIFLFQLWIAIAYRTKMIFIYQFCILQLC